MEKTREPASKARTKGGRLRRKMKALSLADFRKPKRGIDQILRGQVLVTELQTMTGKNAEAAATRIRSAGYKIELHQVRAYFSGRYTPQKKVIVSISERLKLPELRRLSQFPWELLSFTALTLTDINRICSSAHLEPRLRLEDLEPEFCTRDRSPWHTHKFFDPSYTWLCTPADPEKFWLALAGCRVAEISANYESMNAHRWKAITLVASIATIPAVASNLNLLFRCISGLTRRTNRRYVWFNVNWTVVEKIIQTNAYDVLSKLSPFENIYGGAPPDSHLDGERGAVRSYS